MLALGSCQLDYSIKAATHASFTRQFAGGDRTRVALMNDFEDWKSGTHRWKFNQGACVGSVVS